ncbi:MAG: hypothetical protein HND44_22485 [Chloroflexi bacterium]|nr:hypothetical protein [Ardenticatenaceae bacterium]MBL1131208.1 hypothetical protein [Chloroflexota bacterium]NOG37310.1 hypothetical protein [Chloroflexota bacterium]
METQTAVKQIDYEQTIMRKLPPERLPYLVGFARFLEFQTAFAPDNNLLVPDDEVKWDELLAKPDAKRLMRQMAREARAEYLAGETSDIQLTDDGRIAPE